MPGKTLYSLSTQVLMRLMGHRLRFVISSQGILSETHATMPEIAILTAAGLDMAYSTFRSVKRVAGICYTQGVGQL